MDFGEVLSRAWRIVWKHKVLWIFGILAGCGSASNSSFSQGTSSVSYQYSGGGGNVPPGDLPPGLENFILQLQRLEPWVVILISAVLFLAFLVLMLLGIFFSTIGKIGLIRGTRLADQESEKLVFGELFRESMPYFWRVFGFNLLAGITFFIIFLFIGLPVLVLTCFTALLCIIPLMWLAQLVIEQTSIAMVVEDLGIMAGIERGWEVVKSNLGQMIVMALILYVGVSTIGGLVISLPLILIFGPAVAGAIIGTSTDISQALPGGLIAAGLCCAAYLPVLIILSGIIQSYLESTWTLTFLRLTRPAPGGTIPGGDISSPPVQAETGI